MKARIVTWASIADDEDWHARALARMNHEPLHVTQNSWRSLDKTRQKEFLDGTRKPNRKTLDGVGVTASLSQSVHQNALWTALRPDTDVPTCRAILMSMSSRCSPDSLVDSLARGAPPQSYESVVEIDVVTTLVAAIRVAMSEKVHPKAFNYGRALVYILGLICVDPRYKGSFDVMSLVIGEGVLDGLFNGEYVIQKSRAAFEAFGEAMRDRFEDVIQAAGGVHRSLKGRSLNPRTTVDLFHAHASALCTPGEDARVDLIDLLESSCGRHHMHREAIEKLEKLRLFGRQR